MTFKSAYEKYKNAIQASELALNEIDNFFSSFELEYSVTFCKGDGVVILDHERAIVEKISNDQVTRLSKSKTKEQAMIVINELFFSM